MSTDQKLIESALQGNKNALEKLINEIKDKVFNLSLRFFVRIEDAEDATQEIIIKIITNLSSFKGESKFATWVFRVAYNYLISNKKYMDKIEGLTFDIFGKDLQSTTPTIEPLIHSDTDIALLEKEQRIGCTNAMLFCFTKNERIVFILDAIFEISGKEGSYILDISAENYRKLLSRAKNKMKNFMLANCGIVNPDAICKCKKRLKTAIDLKRLDPENLVYSQNLVRKEHKSNFGKEMEDLSNVSNVFATNPYYENPEKLSSELKKIIDSNKYSVFK